VTPRSKTAAAKKSSAKKAAPAKKKPASAVKAKVAAKSKPTPAKATAKKAPVKKLTVKRVLPKKVAAKPSAPTKKAQATQKPAPQSAAKAATPKPAPATVPSKTPAAKVPPLPAPKPVGAKAPSKAPAKSLTYAQSGVSISEGDALVDRLAKRSKYIGGFSGVFPLDLKGIKKPLLLASTDGVGTKIVLAQQLGKLDSIGIDLVAMVINDILVCGALPLFFLDYYATGKLTRKESDAVLEGILKGCEEAGIPLIGGETAEMPGLYKAGEFDLAGFGVGLADKDALIDGRKVKPGDVVIGVESSGVHSNGYSLVRAIIHEGGLDPRKAYPEVDAKATLGDVLLRPTRIYARMVAKLMEKAEPAAMAHITGGGLAGNLERVIPEGCAVIIDPAAWPAPPIFDFLQERGAVASDEMRQVFNMGIGFVIVTRPRRVAETLETIAKSGEKGHVIGIVEAGKQGVRYGKTAASEHLSE